MSLSSWPPRPRDTLSVACAYTDVLAWPLFVGPRQVSASLAAAHHRRDITTRLTTSCASLDAVSVPYDVGMDAQVHYEREGLSVPCLSYPGHGVTFLVRSGTGAFAAQLPSIHVLSGPEARLTLPPTRKVRWDTPPWQCTAREAAPLPDTRDLLGALAKALRFHGPRAAS